MKNFVGLIFFALLGMIALSSGQQCRSINSCPTGSDTICTAVLLYVCGVDGNTYGNACIARCWGVDVNYENGCRRSGCVRGQ